MLAFAGPGSLKKLKKEKGGMINSPFLGAKEKTSNPIPRPLIFSRIESPQLSLMGRWQ